MRIIHVANFNNFKYGADLYSTDRKISSGLIQNGHFVYDFSYRDICRNESIFKTTKFGTGSVNRKLIQVCDNIQPHLLLLGHSELIQPQTLQTIKEQHPDIKIALWYVDALFHKEKTTHVFERLKSIDIVFATTSGTYLREYACQATRAAFIPNMIDPATESFRAFANHSFENDFIFCGRDTNDPIRRKFMHGLKLRAEKEMRCSFKGCLGNSPITGHDYLHFLSRAKMGLNISRRNDVSLYSSDRLVQLTGNGLLTFCPEIPGIEMLFAKDELVFFADLDDLLEKLVYYHTHPDEGRHIAKLGWQKTHSAYNARRITKYMLERVFDQKLSCDYEWATELFH